MRKHLSAVCMAFMLAVLLLPLRVMAAPQFVEEFFPPGEISAPKAPYLRYSGQKDNGDSIQMWCNVPKDILTLSDAYNRWDNSGSGSDGFVARFGIEEYRIYVQTDASIDGGPWQYSAAWDAPEWSGLDEPHYLAFHCNENLGSNPNKFYHNMEVSWLTYIENGKTGFLSPIVTPFTTGNGDTNYHYDLTNHTLSVRCRIVLEYRENGEAHCIFSPWSPETAIGQNATQATLSAPTSIDAPTLSDFSIVVENDKPQGRYYLDVPESVYDGLLYCEAQEDMFEPYCIQAQMRKGGGDWQDVYTANPVWIFSGYRSASPEGGLQQGDAVEVRVRLVCERLGLSSDWSNTVGTATTFTASQWAQSELEEAAALGLIPDCLKGADLTGPITRAEFAAVSVKCYEALTNTKTEPYPSNPFTDTTDVEVLKAFNIGTTNGTGPTTFSPKVLLNREQAATMLTRLYKKIAINGWTLETDGNFANEFRAMFDMPEAFADDENISGWAKDSVYFMKAKGIIDGVGDNKFAPRAVTSSEEAMGYAQATREQAILIAKRMVKKLG